MTGVEVDLVGYLEMVPFLALPSSFVEPSLLCLPNLFDMP